MTADVSHADDRLGNPAELAVTPDSEETLPLDEVVTGRGFITGKSGAGKSNSASVVLEEVLHRGLPVVVIDTEGEYIGLKEEFQVMHVGADDEADVTVGPDDANYLASIITQHHVPTILDLSGFIATSRIEEFLENFATALFEKQKHADAPVLLALEECHEYLPQRGGGDLKETFIKIAKRGRKRGLGFLGISQRPADVDKAYITQADWILWHRLTWPNDVDVAEDVLGNEWGGVVEDLDTGETLLQGDWERGIKQFTWRRKETPDLGAAPSALDAIGMTPSALDGVFSLFDRDDTDLPESVEELLAALRETIVGLDDVQRQMLAYFASNSDDTHAPTEVYEELTGEETTYAYHKLQPLCSARLVRRVGRGEYRFSLRERVSMQLEYNPEAEKDHVDEVVQRIKDELPTGERTSEGEESAR